MSLLTALLCLTAAAAFPQPTHEGAWRSPQSLDHRPPTYRLREDVPAVTLVDPDRELVAAKLYPKPHPLGRLTVIDPTDDVTCKYISRDDLAVLYIPVTYWPAFRGREIYKKLAGPGPNTIDSREGRVFVVFFNSSEVSAAPGGFRRIVLQSAGPPHYQVPAFAPDGPVPDLEQVSLEEFSPAPVLATLCVSPDKPRPVPALYSPDPQLITYLGPSFGIQDLTPVQVTAKQP